MRLFSEPSERPGALEELLDMEGNASSAPGLLIPSWLGKGEALPGGADRISSGVFGE